MIDVVCGLILDSDYNVLMTLRGPDQLRPNLWEMPGGKKEDNESDEVALMRELMEELHVAVTVNPRVIATDTFEWDSNGLSSDEFVFVRCTLYHATIVQGTPYPHQAKALRYVPMRYALRHLGMCPSAYKFYPFVMRYIAALRAHDQRHVQTNV